MCGWGTVLVQAHRCLHLLVSRAGRVIRRPAAGGPSSRYPGPKRSTSAGDTKSGLGRGGGLERRDVHPHGLLAHHDHTGADDPARVGEQWRQVLRDLEADDLGSEPGVGGQVVAGAYETQRHRHAVPPLCGGQVLPGGPDGVRVPVRAGDAGPWPLGLHDRGREVAAAWSAEVVQAHVDQTVPGPGGFQVAVRVLPGPGHLLFGVADRGPEEAGAVGDAEGGGLEPGRESHGLPPLRHDGTGERWRGNPRRPGWNDAGMRWSLRRRACHCHDCKEARAAAYRSEEVTIAIHECRVRLAEELLAAAQGRVAAG